MIDFRRIALLCVPALLVHAAFAAAAGLTWRERLDQAERFCREGRNEDAVEAASGVLADAEKDLGRQSRDLGRALLRLGRIYGTAGYMAPLPKIERLLSAIESKDFETRLALGVVLRAEEKYAEAEAALKNAAALHPDDPQVADELIRVYDDTGRFGEEVRLLRLGIERKPKEYDLYSRLAHAYIRLGRSAEAKEAFAKAGTIDSRFAHIEEGYFYLHSGEPRHARAVFEDVIAVDSASAMGYHHMGAYMGTGQRYAEAEKYLRRALEKLEADPDAGEDDLVHTLTWLGNVVRDQGRYAEAEAFYLKASDKAHPGSRRQFLLLQALAKLYAAEGDTARAERIYRQAAADCSGRFTRRYWEAALPLIDLGRFYLAQGRRTEAEAAAGRAEAFCWDLPIGEGRFVLLGLVSQLYTELGDVSKRGALDDRLLPLRRTMPFDPDLVWAEKDAAALDLDAGRSREAEEGYRRAIAVLDHNDYWNDEADALDQLAAVCERRGERRESVDARNKAIALRARPEGAEPPSREER
ncbi:MAG: hypothetical protein ACHQ2Z_00280 [Elusimicrobiota bacterium]